MQRTVCGLGELFESGWLLLRANVDVLDSP
jgi:hypothetical protein